MARAEEWRAVEGWPYEVSDQGRVRRSEPGQGAQSGRVLVPEERHGGYLRVVLHRNGSPQGFLVHHLVLEAFVGPRPEGMECNHRDGDKADNRPENLEWVTRTDNIRHAEENGLRADRRGHRNGNSKLNPVAVKVIRHFLKKPGYTKARIARAYGVSRQTISDIAAGRTWIHVQ